MLVDIYADLHVHLGWAGSPGAGVKISAARDLTLAGILQECQERKGISMVGVIDATTSGALEDFEALLASGVVHELADGGLSYRDEVTLIPGAEIEVIHAPNRKPLHLLCYLPGARQLREFAAWQRSLVKNLSLSTQRHHGTSPSDAVSFVGQLGGIVIPAHIFTPFKSAFAAAPRLSDLIDPGLWRHIPAVELGLSSNTELADRLSELQSFSYVTNSDAHSLGKIAREYNRIAMAAPTFGEWQKALRGVDGRAVQANFGLDPRLGKYHRTFCLDCDQRCSGEAPVLICPLDPSHKLVVGVLDRIEQIRSLDRSDRIVRQRPPYVHQIPLQFVPGLGRRGMNRLLSAFGTEMAVLHQATELELVEVVGQRLASLVLAARSGHLGIESGAGGVYGRVLSQ